MLLITPPILTTLSIFFTITYLTFVASAIYYIIPLLSSKNFFTSHKSSYYLISSNNLFNITSLIIILSYMIYLVFIFPTTSLWFGHITWTSANHKNLLLVTFFFLIINRSIYSHLNFSSKEVYDFIIVLYWFYYWVIILGTSTSIFTLIFLIEVLSSLVFLLHITSAFSTYKNINNNDFSTTYLFQSNTPTTFLNSILTLYWMSLLASIILFFFLIVFYTKLLTLEFFLIESIFYFILNSQSTVNILEFSFVWSLLLLAIFLKCGVVPLYVWKPTFFKGLTIFSLLFYVTFYYFFLFILVINLLSTSFSSLWLFYNYINTIIIITGLVILTSIIFESYYLKTFIAVSSILNSIFLFLAISVSENSTTFLWL